MKRASVIVVGLLLSACGHTSAVYTCDSPGIRCGGPSWIEHPELAGQVQQQRQLEDTNRRVRAMQWDLARLRSEEANR
jgi:hypothetical protein